MTADRPMRLDWARRLPALARRFAAPGLLCLAVAGAAAWLATREGGPQTPQPRPWPEIVNAIAAEQPGALGLAKAAAEKDWPKAEPVVLGMLQHESWQVRAAACEVLTGRGDPGNLVYALPRASDGNWRVRSAAYELLTRLGGLPTQPLRGTALDDREGVLLAWLDEYDERTGRHILPALCEVYAGQSWVEFGRPLSGRCLACHAGDPPAAPAESNRCGECHPAVHSAWSQSAHGQSAARLRLATLDPVTREAGLMSFSPVVGINCTQCHRPRVGAQTRAAGTSPATAPSPPRCPYDLAPAGYASCEPCHSETYREWQAWSRQPHPKRADWPPGQVDLNVRGDARTCIDCHMPQRATGEGPPVYDHLWATRGSVRMLREGLEVRVDRLGEEGDESSGMALSVPTSPVTIRLTLTNLAGHAYPAGTRRRGLQVRMDGEPPASAPAATGEAQSQPAMVEALVVTMSPRTVGSPAPLTEPALAPGQQRIFAAPLPRGAGALRWQVAYLVDLWAAPPPGTVLQAGRESVEDWVRP